MGKESGRGSMVSPVSFLPGLVKLRHLFILVTQGDEITLLYMQLTTIV